MNLFGVAGLVAVFLLVVVLVAVVVTAVVLVARARRLDRLHRRVDAARAALLGVLDRRAAVVRTIVAAPSAIVLASERRALRAGARAAEQAGTDEDREVAENDLARLLAALDVSALPVDVAAELADADARVVVARRVHNDAVRDTRALRGRRMVRVLRLAGSAPFPRYFEIAEVGALTPAPATSPEPPPYEPHHDPAATGPFAVPRITPGSGVREADGSHGENGSRAVTPSAATPSAPGADTVAEPVPGPPRRARDAARVVALDDDGRVLLLRAQDQERPDSSFWFLPGGAVEPGEEPARAAARQFAAASGRVCPVEDFTGPVWLREVRFASQGVTYDAREMFFVLADAGGEVDTSGVPGLGRRRVAAHRWWTPAELAVTVDVVHPRQLADLVSDPASLRPPDAPIAVR